MGQEEERLSGKADVVRLRDARLEDRDAVLDMQEEAFAGEALRMTPELFPTVLVEKGASLLVAEHDGVSVGYCLLRQRRYRPWAGCDFLCVSPAFWGQGIGEKLLLEAYGRTRRPLLRLFVKPSNTPARALYRRLGFKQTGRRKQNYANGEDALILMKLLWLGK